MNLKHGNEKMTAKNSPDSLKLMGASCSSLMCEDNSRAGKGISCFVLFFLVFMCGIATADENAFPLRSNYSVLSFISGEELNTNFDRAIIIDSRNRKEFEVIRIEGAHNLPADVMSEAELSKLRGKQGTELLVFYCNGVYCPKSYKAGQKAVSWGFSNVRVYDSGIFAWAKTYPDHVLAFGEKKSPGDLSTFLEIEDKFEKSRIDPKVFIEKVESGKYKVIDIRDTPERGDNELRLPRVLVLSFDNFVDLLSKKSMAIPGNHLLIIDNVGRQVRWLMYYLEMAGIRDYYFLRGGMRQWIEEGYDSSGRKNTE